MLFFARCNKILGIEEFSGTSLSFLFYHHRVMGLYFIQCIVHVGVNKMELVSKREMSKEYMLSTYLKHFSCSDTFFFVLAFQGILFFNLTIEKS